MEKKIQKEEKRKGNKLTLTISDILKDRRSSGVFYIFYPVSLSRSPLPPFPNFYQSKNVKKKEKKKKLVRENFFLRNKIFQEVLDMLITGSRYKNDLSADTHGVLREGDDRTRHPLFIFFGEEICGISAIPRKTGPIQL